MNLMFSQDPVMSQSCYFSESSILKNEEGRKTRETSSETILMGNKLCLPLVKQQQVWAIIEKLCDSLILEFYCDVEDPFAGETLGLFYYLLGFFMLSRKLYVCYKSFSSKIP